MITFAMFYRYELLYYKKIPSIYWMTLVHLGENTSKYCCYIIVVHVNATGWISFARVFSFIYWWVLIFAYLLFISWFIYFWRWCIDKLGVFHANQTSMCLDPHLNYMWGWQSETGLSPPVKDFYWPFQGRYYFCGSFVFCFFVSHAFVSVHCCLVVTCWEKADLLALVGNVYCIFCYLPMWYPGSGVVLDCIVSWSLRSFLLS